VCVHLEREKCGSTNYDTIENHMRERCCRYDLLHLTTAQTYCADLHYRDELRTYKCPTFTGYRTHKLPCMCKAILQYGQTWHQLT